MLSKSKEVSGIDLRQQTLGFLSANTFRKPTIQEMAVLKPQGYDVVLPTRAETTLLVTAKNLGQFEPGQLDWINRSPRLRDYKPPALTVALRSKELFLADSFEQSQAFQLQMIEIESQAVQELIPDARAVMLPASTTVQLYLSFLERTGRRGWGCTARALDKGYRGADIGVGPSMLDSRLLSVGMYQRGCANRWIGVLASVVFIGK